MTSFVTLALDPSKKRSGAAVLFEGSILSHGVAQKQLDREYFVRAAAEAASCRQLPLVVVAEEWDKPRHRRTRDAAGNAQVRFDAKWTFKTVLGMGEGWGLWAAELERYGIRAIVRATPNVWRDGLFGKRRGRDTASAKQMALLFVRQVFGLDLEGDDDAAEAICLGVWLSRSYPDLSDVIQKEKNRLNRAALRKR